MLLLLVDPFGEHTGEGGDDEAVFEFVQRTLGLVCGRWVEFDFEYWAALEDFVAVSFASGHQGVFDMLAE